MNNNIKLKIQKNNRWMFPLIVLLFTSIDTVAFGTNSVNIFLFVPRIMGVYIIFYSLIKNKGIIKGRKIKFLMLAIMFFIILCSSYINKTEIETIFTKLIMILTAFMITSQYTCEEYLETFDKFMYIISIVAIITEIFAYILPQVFNYIPKVTNTAGISFSYFGIGGLIMSTFSNTFIRASSIFWEPGAFAIYLVFAIFIQLFFVEKINKKKIILYSICLLFTFSTTGYISLIVLFLSFLFSKKGDYMSKRLKWIFVFAIVLTAFLVIFAENSMFYNMIMGKIANRESTSVTRYASIVNGLEIGFDHPLFGVSPNNMRDYMAKYAMNSKFNFGANPMNTNTTTYQFAAYGVVFGLIFVIGTFLFLRETKERVICRILLFLMILLVYCGEAFYSFFPFIFVFYGFDSINKKRSIN